MWRMYPAIKFRSGHIKIFRNSLLCLIYLFTDWHPHLQYGLRIDTCTLYISIKLLTYSSCEKLTIGTRYILLIYKWCIKTTDNSRFTNASLILICNTPSLFQTFCMCFIHWFIKKTWITDYYLHVLRVLIPDYKGKITTIGL